jgi:uncharacterized protein
MSEIVLKTLKRIEKENKIKIILAIEAGSKCMGLEAKKSDYDVRFIYIHENAWYLSLEENQKTDITYKEEEKDLDIFGCEYRKLLRQLMKSNPFYLEWLQSDIVKKKIKKKRNI